MVSAGDHERMPDKDEAQDVEDLTDGHDDNKAKREAIKKMRDKINIGQKSKTVERMKSMSTEEYQEYLKGQVEKGNSKPSTPSSPVKAKKGKNLTLPPNAPIKNKPTGSANKDNNSSGNELIKMAMKGNNGINMGNRLKSKLQR